MSKPPVLQQILRDHGREALAGLPATSAEGDPALGAGLRREPMTLLVASLTSRVAPLARAEGSGGGSAKPRGGKKPGNLGFNHLLISSATPTRLGVPQESMPASWRTVRPPVCLAVLLSGGDLRHEARRRYG